MTITRTRAREHTHTQPHPTAARGVGGAILVIAFWLLFTRRVHTVFASTGLTNVYRQKLTGNLFGRIVDGNYYFIDGHARATDLFYLPTPPPLLFISPRVPFRERTERYYRKSSAAALCSFVH